MTKRSFLASYKYQLSRAKTIPIFLVCYNIGMMLLTMLISYIEYGEIDFVAYECNMQDMFAAFTVFVFSIAAGYDCFNTSAANGVSRKTTAISSLAAAFTVGAAAALTVSVLFPLFAAITDSEELWILELAYGTRWDRHLYGDPEFLIRIELFIICTFFCAAAHMLGTAISAVFYRLNKFWSIVVIAAFFILCWCAPMYLGYLSLNGVDVGMVMQNIVTPIMKFFGCAYVNGKLFGNIWQGAGAFMLLAAVFTLITWLFVRRAGVKPLAIRHE